MYVLKFIVLIIWLIPVTCFADVESIKILSPGIYDGYGIDSISDIQNGDSWTAIMPLYHYDQEENHALSTRDKLYTAKNLTIVKKEVSKSECSDGKTMEIGPNSALVLIKNLNIKDGPMKSYKSELNQFVLGTGYFEGVILKTQTKIDKKITNIKLTRMKDKNNEPSLVVQIGEQKSKIPQMAIVDVNLVTDFNNDDYPDFLITRFSDGFEYYVLILSQSKNGVTTYYVAATAPFGGC